MLDVGVAELLLLVVLPCGLAVFGLYWVIRLAVRHALQDDRTAVRSERAATDASATVVTDTVRRRSST
jgi:hypothetical protein